MSALIEELVRCEQSASGFRAAAITLPSTAPLEALADDAFLAMSKLRDHLVRQDRNIAACNVDRAIEAMEAACREITSPPRTIEQHLAERGR